ncbi:SIMPL domain-containing protein [Borreliella kurtenbachii]|uniref:SIMPL domain-containing protein n=1 Tax=Borreliella kurtenbachii TaxID=1196056 RepID=UPI0026591ABA|nr:SIMPL domain-containing protein [Borreliella kurtenbachii]WKC86990.1 SIMPL domain-containing protein [Borreliella kurtenbachii]
MPSETKDLFFLILFLSLLIIISYRIKKVGIKNSNYIAAKGMGKKEILLVSLIWDLEYDLNGDSAYVRIKANNLNLSKIKTFLLNIYYYLYYMY